MRNEERRSVKTGTLRPEKRRLLRMKGKASGVHNDSEDMQLCVLGPTRNTQHRPLRRTHVVQDPANRQTGALVADNEPSSPEHTPQERCRNGKATRPARRDDTWPTPSSTPLGPSFVASGRQAASTKPGIAPVYSSHLPFSPIFPTPNVVADLVPSAAQEQPHSTRLRRRKPPPSELKLLTSVYRSLVYGLEMRYPRRCRFAETRDAEGTLARTYFDTQDALLAHHLKPYLLLNGASRSSMVVDVDLVARERVGSTDMDVDSDVETSPRPGLPNSSTNSSILSYQQLVSALILRHHMYPRRSPGRIRKKGDAARKTSALVKSHTFEFEISTEFNRTFLSFLSFKETQSFQQVEEVYYPYEWHINTRRQVHLFCGLSRVTRFTLGDRGVFGAYDFGSTKGCRQATEVIVKAWKDPEDLECRTERRAYEILNSECNAHVPSVVASVYDDHCQVYVLALEKLGPTLEDLLNLEPNKCFDERTVLAVAIQLLEIYSALHNLNVVHNGVKPANICLAAPKGSSTSLHLIDFGLSYFLNQSTPIADRANTVGNRVFLSVFGHHGISQSQRDDLESLGYLFSFLYHGSLPWFDPLRSSRRRRAASSLPAPEIWSIKASTTASVLFQGMHPCFQMYWKDVKSLAFGEQPEYLVLKAYFMDAWEEKGFAGTPGEFNWATWWDELENENKVQKPFLSG
ncbi:hypothetical protein NLJ89_g5090 [Agrocybe chaxingu]|uniref:Protein kinase domain-containing protein n=1 Tax=Agrocybe chaxingu TaxID=84603 RepID=A0A9W8K1A8_9AGAR|nr:hypothetical protein NLJ89_g5090 [Agrocybe chaxingu]